MRSSVSFYSLSCETYSGTSSTRTSTTPRASFLFAVVRDVQRNPIASREPLTSTNDVRFHTRPHASHWTPSRPPLRRRLRWSEAYTPDAFRRCPPTHPPPSPPTRHPRYEADSSVNSALSWVTAPPTLIAIVGTYLAFVGLKRSSTSYAVTAYPVRLRPMRGASAAGPE